MNKLLIFFLFFLFYACSDPVIMHNEGESCSYDTECTNGLSCINKVCTSTTECTNHSDCNNSIECKNNSCLCKLGECTPYFPCKENLCSDDELCSETDSYPFYKCSCEDKYTYNGEFCEFDCSNLEHSHVNSSNSGCSCNENYIPEDGLCIFNCNSFPFKETNDSNNGCICQDGYQEIEAECTFICDQFSVTNSTNDGCECINSYLKDDDGNCLYDCSYDMNSQTNEMNDGCSCNEGWGLNNGICTFICDETSIVNSTNDGCDCRDEYQEENGECIYKCEENSHVNETNNGCICNVDYELDNNSCTFICDMDYSIPNPTNDDCICEDNYKLTNGLCLYDCSNLVAAHVNETNDGCVCNDNTTNCLEDDIHYAFVKHHPSGSISSSSNTITFDKFRITNSIETIESVVIGSFKNQQDKYDMFYSYDNRPFNGITRYNHDAPYEIVSDGYFFPATSKEALINIIEEAIANGECAKSPDNFSGGNLNRDDNFWTNFCPRSGLIEYIQNSDL